MTTCQKYKQKQEELQVLVQQFEQELKRANEDGKEYNKEGKSILELKKQIEQKLQNFEKEFKEFLSTTIKAITPEGKEITLDIQQELNNSKELYKELNLQEWTNELPQTITLTNEQINQIKEKIEKHGFNKIKIFPSIETQQETIQKLAIETHKPMEELDDSEQYSDDGLWTSSEVNLDDIKNINRPKGKCYIQLYKDDQEVPDETLDKTYIQAREEQKQNNLQGYTLAEYLIFQREFTEQNKKHPDRINWTWTTDSEIGEVPSMRVLDLGWWDSDVRQVRVYSADSDDPDDDLGFRSSAVLSI